MDCAALAMPRRPDAGYNGALKSADDSTLKTPLPIVRFSDKMPYLVHAVSAANHRASSRAMAEGAGPKPHRFMTKIMKIQGPLSAFARFVMRCARPARCRNPCGTRLSDDGLVRVAMQGATTPIN
jgi:hypothetical protein